MRSSSAGYCRQDLGFREVNVIGRVTDRLHTAKTLLDTGIMSPTRPDKLVRIGVAYLHNLLVRFGGDARLAVAAYYQGPAAVHRFGVLPGSRGYVNNVLRLWGVFGG